MPHDDAEFVRWYKLLAEQGNPDAQCVLGVRHANGQSVPQDDREAARWYRLAADQGQADAQFYLGLMYFCGEGVPQDDVAAYMWVNLARASGNEDARELRDRIAKRMSGGQIAAAQRAAREWRARRR